MGVSNNITAFLNFVGLLCSVPVIGAGIWLASKQDNECLRLARWPVIILGVLLLLVSLAGFVGAYWNKQGLLAAYLFCMVVLIVLLLVVLVFAFVVTRPDGSYPIPGRSYREYRLAGYSAWLRHYVVDHWARIRLCLSASNVCQRLGREQPFLTAEQYFQTDLSPLQSGCCKPPTMCGYAYVNPTVWINPSNSMADADCAAWSNDQGQLCYDCNSCKAGLLGNLRHEWRKANVALIVAAVVFIWIYIIGCCAFKNAQTEDLFRRYKHAYCLAVIHPLDSSAPFACREQSSSSPNPMESKGSIHFGKVLAGGNPITMRCNGGPPPTSFPPAAEGYHKP